ncbi:MAG: haloacid dehalogenase type II [Luteolibacter sp.]|jgi:2-haloacid dehalogenase|nr:haloacid dehalogenase type II [Luteolibacter sp.]
MSHSPPQAIAFDVVETLFSLDPMRQRLSDLGLSGESLELFFARLLRNGFALDASGTFTPFGEVARATLEGILAAKDIASDVSRIDHALAGFAELPAHPDVAPAFQHLRENGIPIFALTNGSADNTRQLLEQADLLAHVERIISIDEVRHWKPRREVYLQAADVAGVRPGQLALVAAHAWDIHGASQASLMTGWVSRLEKRFDPSMNPPDVSADSLDETCRKLLDRG